MQVQHSYLVGVCIQLQLYQRHQQALLRYSIVQAIHPEIETREHSDRDILMYDCISVKNNDSNHMLQCLIFWWDCFGDLLFLFTSIEHF